MMGVTFKPFSVGKYPAGAVAPELTSMEGGRGEIIT